MAAGAQTGSRANQQVRPDRGVEAGQHQQHRQARLGRLTRKGSHLAIRARTA